eukprot:NODE_6244_length_1689_cov_10.516005.p1 GENE.NODE_6244_length_1689_cov_10.516005~~NODE_6244_length_1689_cov_10.516005.p1  ORF type:complete len:347 (+),score=80.80 NODE_6244_length_1689_cov_10.516005:390-1430(+)
MRRASGKTSFSSMSCSTRWSTSASLRRQTQRTSSLASTTRRRWSSSRRSRCKSRGGTRELCRAPPYTGRSVQRPIPPAAKKNEIFVDILERITVLMNANGLVVNSAIDGSIQLKSYLVGGPELKLALNEDIVIKGQDATPGYEGYGAVVLDDCNFHECVDLQDFANFRTLSFRPPDGEFAVMNYRITGVFRAPFRISPFLEMQTPHKAEITIKVRADIPEQNYGGNVQVSCILPKNTASVSTELGQGVTGQSAEYLAAEKRLSWTIKKLQGGTEATIKCRVALSAAGNCEAIRKEVGPVSLNYEVPMYNVSNLQVKYLRVVEQQKSYNPCRWVRYVTQSSSYVCRF